MMCTIVIGAKVIELSQFKPKITKDCTEDTTEDVTEDTTEYTTENTSEDSTENTSEDCTEDTTDDSTTEDTSDDTSEETTTESTTKNTTPDTDVEELVKCMESNLEAINKCGMDWEHNWDQNQKKTASYRKIRMCCHNWALFDCFQKVAKAECDLNVDWDELLELYKEGMDSDTQKKCMKAPYGSRKCRIPGGNDQNKRKSIKPSVVIRD
ncbi:unnamed protein product [Oppiella nova]|uniref:Uncharacterized protein n=1 Tax=Oppiella nova TaxID=334625 RepID=A0A7R9M7Y4_9ACAR|nr:unnamed protein product [Oppiella nova]CAG2172481.1 unnamed protein product [Oppiella nova]